MSSTVTSFLGKFDVTVTKDTGNDEVDIDVFTDPFDSIGLQENRQEFRNLPSVVIRFVESQIRQFVVNTNFKFIKIGVEQLLFRRWDDQLRKIIFNHANGYRNSKGFVFSVQETVLLDSNNIPDSIFREFTMTRNAVPPLPF